MKILMLYDTYSSGTQTASELVTKLLQNAGHTVTLLRMGQAQGNEILDNDLTILASPSWMQNSKDGQPHMHFFTLQEKLEHVSLEGKRFAIFGLGESTYARFCGAVDVMSQYVADKKGVLVVPPLKIDAFYFNQDNNTQILTQWVTSLQDKLRTL